MTTDFPSILKELDRLCDSSKYVGVYSDPHPFLEVIKESFSSITNRKEKPRSHLSVDLGAPQAILQNILHEEVTLSEEISSSIVPQELLSASLVRMREVESDHSLAHMMERFSSSEVPPGGFEQSFVSLLEKGEKAPHHEAFSLILLAVKIALCHDNQKLELNFGDLLTRLQGLKLIHPEEVVKKVRIEVNKRQAGLLKAPLPWISVGGTPPQITTNETKSSILAHGEIGVLSLTDAFQCVDKQYSVRVTCGGAFQIGWAPRGSRFSDNVDLRSVEGCCFYDGLTIWDVKTARSPPLSRSWCEGEVVTCTIDSDAGVFRFQRNGEDCGLSASIPASYGRWQPVVSLVKDMKLLKAYEGMYPDVCESLFYRSLYVESQSPLASWYWGKHSVGVEIDEKSVTSSASTSYVVGSTILSSGIHQWSLNITNDTTEVKYGVVSEDCLHCLDKMANCKESLLWANGSDSGQFTQSGRRKKRETVPTFNVGDTLHVEVDFVVGKITFGKNNAIIKVATEVRSCGWVPVVYFTKKSKIHLLSQRHIPASNDSLVSRSSRRRQMKPDTKRAQSVTAKSSFRSLLKTCAPLSANEGLMINHQQESDGVNQMGDFSISVWVRLESDQPTSSPWLSFLLKGSDFTSCRMPGLFVSSRDLSLALCVTTSTDWNTTLRSTKPIKKENWTHIGVSCRNKLCELFIDGVLNNSMELATPPVHNKEPWYIGKCPSGVKKPCADYPGIRGQVSSMLHGHRAVEALEMAYIASSPPTVGLEFILKGLTRPCTRLRFGPGGTVSVPSRAVPDAFTIEALVIAISLSEKQNCLISQGSSAIGGFCFGVTHSGALYIQGYQQELITGRSNFVIPGRLHHIAVVVSEKVKVTFYVDGCAAGVGVMISKGIIETPFSPLVVGASSKGWSGDVLDVRMWHEARTQTHIESNMSRNIPSCYQSKVMKGKIPKCNKDHTLIITDDITAFSCRDCQKSAKGERWWCTQCTEGTCFKCRSDCRCATLVEPAHWLRFTEGHGFNTYDATVRNTGRLTGAFSGSCEWVTSPIKEEEVIEFPQLKSPVSSMLVSEAPLTLLKTLASVATSFQNADIVEKSGFGIGMAIKPPRQAVFPFVTTFNLLYSLIGQLHQERSSSQAIVYVLELLAANLYAISSSHFVDQAKTGLGHASAASSTSFCDRLLQRVRTVALDAPKDACTTIHEASANVVSVGITIFFPNHSRRREFLCQLLSESDQESSSIQLNSVCRHISEDLELVRGLLCPAEGGEGVEGVSSTDLISKLFAHAREGVVGAPCRLLLLLQQTILGMVPLSLESLDCLEQPTPLLSLLNKTDMTKPPVDELKEMPVRNAHHLLKVDGGLVTHQGAGWASATTERKISADSGCHIFYFRITNEGDGDICVGFAGEGFDPTVMIGGCKMSVGWQLKGAIHCLGKKTNQIKHPSVDNGRLLSIQIDTTTSSTTVVLRDEDNGKEFIVMEMGQALETLLKKTRLICAAVSLNQSGQAVTFLHHQVLKQSNLFPQISQQMVQPMDHMKELLLPYSDSLYKSFNEEIQTDIPINIPSRPLFKLLKSYLSSLLLNPSLLSVSNLSEMKNLLRSVESIRENLSSEDQFGIVDELEELIIMLSLTGVEEATQFISCDVSKKIEERPDRLLEGGFKESDILSAELGEFLDEILKGGDVANDLRTCVINRIGPRPFQQLAAQGEEIANALRSMTAAVLYHAGALGMALETAKLIQTIKTEKDEGVVPEKLGDLKLHKLLVKVFDMEKSFRMWCRQQKTSKKLDYQAQASVLHSKMSFLLDLMPRLDEGCENEEAQFSVVEQVVKFAKGSDDMNHLRNQIKISGELAKDREKGLALAKELLRFDDLPPTARAAIISKFKFFRKEFNALHYLDGFHYVGLDARSALKASFDGLFMRLGKELESAVESGDIDLQLVVLNAWGMRLMPEDHSLLFHARLFDTLHLILQQQEDIVLDTYSHIKKLKTLKKAALKLVVLLATQVATQGEIGQVSSSISGALPPLMPAALKKQNSGSGTFTDSVFQLLHQELFSSLNAMKLESHSSDNDSCETVTKKPGQSPLNTIAKSKSSKKSKPKGLR